MPRDLRLKDAIVDRKTFGNDIKKQRESFASKLKEMSFSTNDFRANKRETNAGSLASSREASTAFVDMFSFSGTDSERSNSLHATSPGVSSRSVKTFMLMD